MKIRIKDIIKFSNKNEGPRLTFINNIKAPKIATTEGGDYWVTSTSAIAKAIKFEDESYIVDKIEELNGKVKAHSVKMTKLQFSRNIEILENFLDFEFHTVLPNSKVNFISKPRDYEIIHLRGLPVQIRPTHIFTFEEDGVKKIGGIWLVTLLNGFKEKELKLFVDALYRYLKVHYSKDYQISEEYCIGIDTYLKKTLNYENIKGKNPSRDLNKLLDEMNAMI